MNKKIKNMNCRQLCKALNLDYDYQYLTWLHNNKDIETFKNQIISSVPIATLNNI